MKTKNKLGRRKRKQKRTYVKRVKQVFEIKACIKCELDFTPTESVRFTCPTCWNFNKDNDNGIETYSVAITKNDKVKANN